MARTLSSIKMSDGTYIPLKDYIERIFNEREKARAEAAKVSDFRLENLEGWREEIQRSQDKIVTKDFYDVQHTMLVQRMDKVEARQSRLVGVGIALVAVAGIVGAFFSHMLKP